LEKIPLLILSAFLSVITFVAQHSGGAVVTLDRLSVGYRIANAFISYMRYIGKALWPSQLAVIYPTSNLSIITIAVCTFLFILLSVFFFYIGRRRKYAAVGWLWYIGALVPVIGLVQVGSQAIADRYMYIPIVGLLIIIAWGVKDLINNKRGMQIVTAVLAVAVISVSLILTRMQVNLWQNGLTLFEHTLKVTEKNAVAENGYGYALFETGRLNEAKMHFSKAVQISPGLADARNNLGRVFLKEEKPNEAIECFNELIRRKEDTAEVYYNLAAAMSKQGKYDEAIKYFNKALELDPKYPNVQSEMGTVLLMAGRTKEAVAKFNKSLETSTDPMEVYVNLAIAYSRLGDDELSKQNRLKAMELKTDNPDVLNNLAWLLATGNNTSTEDADKAIGLAQLACELTKNEKAEQLDTLAAAYAAAGRFEEAVKTAGQAIDMAKAGGRKDLVSEIQNRVEFYRTGQRYRQK
jgi:tetratricopeptide (TPR) repeat protein